MKKEKSGKKSLLWLWITIAVVVVVAAAGVLCVALGVFDSKEEEQFTSKIYWNLDRAAVFDPTTGMSGRESAEDGKYYIRFAVGGTIEELPILDGKLANRIDTKDIMCLKFDETGTVIDVVDVEEVYVKIADKAYVQQVTGNSVQANSSQALNGMPIKLEMTDDTCVNYVATRTGTPGDPCAIEPMDQIVVYGLDENTPSAVFITDRFWYSDVYWRVSERMYDATNKCTTRQPAEDGYWYMDWSVNGETVTLRTKKEDVANAWDGYTVNVACCGMVFDENGDVIDCFNAGLAARGAIMSNNYEITTLAEDGSSFTATRIMFGTEVGKTYTSVIDENTKIYNVNSTAEVTGEPTELQMDDRVVVIADAMGKAKIVYVTNRMVDSPMYYNVSRSWSSGLKQTQRKPDADGWYNIKLAALGREVTYRTRDRELVNKIDSYSLSVFGLKVENGIILKAYDAVCVAGNYSFAANNFVDSVDGLVIATSNAAGTAANGVMTPDCEVYDVSGHGAFRGVATTVREGDRVLCYKNAPGEINYVYILNRYEAGTVLYWNVNRYYSGGQSTRGNQKYQGEPLLDEDGYYHFRVIKVGGTDVTWVKTKDKTIVDRMDSYGTPTAFSLRVNSEGVVTAAYPCAAASGGYQAANYLYITHADEETAGKWHIKAYSTGATGTFQVSDDVKIYNFSQDTYVKGDTALPGTEMKGTRTSIHAGDRVSCIAGRDGKVHTIFVVERKVAGTTLAFRKGGKATQSEDGFWHFELLIDGVLKNYKTNDELLANKINAQNYAFSIKADGDVITHVYHAVACNQVTAQASGAYYDVESISGGQITLRRNRVGQSDVGNTITMKIAYNYKAYTIDPNAPQYGKQITLKKGDRIFGYLDYNSQLATIYVAYECTREGGNMAYCEHCGKTVHWENIAAGYAPSAGYIPEVAHYYYPFDTATTSATTFGTATNSTEGEYTEIILDLNGKTVTRKGTNGAASGGVVTAGYGNTVKIVDFSAGNTGKMVAENGIAYSGATGLLHIQEKSTLIVEEGLFDISGATCSYNSANAGLITVGGNLIVNGGTFKGWKESTNANWGGTVIGSWGNTNVTINGGTFVGGKVANMGGTFSINGNLTINGGKIYGGTAVVGDNIRFNNGDLLITGGEIDGGIHISSAKSVVLSGKPVIKAGANYGLKPGGIKLDVTGLQAGASVYVDASGVFTTELSSSAAAQALIDNGALKAGAEGMMLKVEGNAVSAVSDGVLRVWTNPSKLPDMGRWQLGVDVTTTAVSAISGELYIDLNGFDITREVAEGGLSAPQVFNVGSGNKLTIDDTSTAGDGTVSIIVPDGASINTYSAVIHIPEDGEMVLEGGIIDGSNIDNTYVNANNGTISVGGKLTVNGGAIKGFKRGSANGGAIGAWANTEIVINGGTIYAGGSFLNSSNVQKVNGAAIATTGSLTINGGEIVGPGNTSNAEERSRSGGLIYANGDSLIINGGTFRDGFGTGYGFNIYYERNYRGSADENGVRPTITGGGEVVIGGDAFIKGGVTVRSSKSAEPVKLTVKDEAMIDATGAVAATNIRLYNAELYLNDETTAATTSPADANYDISMIYTCQGAVAGYQVGNSNGLVHNFNGDSVCDDCGYDENAPKPWTDATKLPTTGNYFLDVDVETSATTTLTGNLILDLKGHTITHKALVSAIQTGAHKLTITDTSDEKDGLITTTTLNGDAKGLVYVQANGELTLEAGTIDASNITSTFTGANAGAITIGNGKINGENAYGAATINGGKVMGMKSSGNGSAIGMMNLTSLTINGGDIIGNTVTKSINGTGYGGAIVANGHLTITGGKIYGGSAEVGGDNIFVNNASAVVTITGGEIDGGVELNAYAATSKISGTVTIKEGAKYGLKLKSGKTIDLTGLTGGEIYIDADGVFTTNFNSVTEAQLVKALLKAGENGKKLELDGTAIKMVSSLTIALSETTAELTEGENKTITATVDPAEATVTWTSSDEAVATVADGKITAVSAGTATITATATYNGIEVTATCTVTVKAPVSSDPIESQDWTEWTDGAKLPTEGKIKLMTNITVSARANLTGELWLDLNGYTISSSAAVYDTNGNKLVIDDLSGKTGDQLGTIKTTATSANASGSVIQVGAVANGAAGELILNNGIIDGTTVVNSKANATTGTVAVTNATNSYSSFTMNGGIIKGQKSSVMTSGVGGSALALHNGTTFVMNGGELRSHSAGDFSANVCCTGTCICAGTANITINGGTLVAGRAQNHGGAIYTKGNLTMNGGTIIGGQSQNSGAIYSEGDQVTILGGMIYGGKTVANPGNGGAVDKYKGTVTIGGNAVILGGVNVRGSAKLVLKDAPVIDTSFGLQQRFDIRVNGGSIHLSDASSAAIQSATGYYSLTYGTDGKVNGVKAFAAVTYTESATLPTSGAVKLTGPVTLTEAVVTTGNLYIDLNGQTVTMTGTTYAIKAMHTVVITDSSAAKTGKIVNTTTSLTSDAAVLYITAGKKVVLAGGTLDGSAVTNGFASSYAGTVTVGNDASFIMLGGEVKGQCSASTGSTGKGGGCIGGWGRSNVIIYGGTLTAKNKGTSFPGNAVAAQGSCIATGGNVEIHGGELYGTMATNHGGNIYCTGNLLITGGLISGGYSNNSGVIAASGEKCTITGGTIVGGTAHASSGLGGASIDYAKDGGVLTIGGNAKIAGGVSIRLNAKLVLKDKAVIDMNMAGQTQKKFNIQIKSGNCSIWLNDTTGTALASATSGKWDVAYDNAGNITGITAK